MNHEKKIYPRTNLDYCKTILTTPFRVFKRRFLGILQRSKIIKIIQEAQGGLIVKALCRKYAIEAAFKDVVTKKW